MWMEGLFVKRNQKETWDYVMVKNLGVRELFNKKKQSWVDMKVKKKNTRQ